MVASIFMIRLFSFLSVNTDPTVNPKVNYIQDLWTDQSVFLPSLVLIELRKNLSLTQDDGGESQRRMISLVAIQDFIARLTNNLETDEIASSGLGADLALVKSGIFQLGRAELQSPFTRVPLMVDGKTSVFGVNRSANAENVQVTMTDPRHLHRPLKIYIRLSLTRHWFLVRKGLLTIPIFSSDCHKPFPHINRFSRTMERGKKEALAFIRYNRWFLFGLTLIFFSSLCLTANRCAISPTYRTTISLATGRL